MTSNACASGRGFSSSTDDSTFLNRRPSHGLDFFTTNARPTDLRTGQTGRKQTRSNRGRCPHPVWQRAVIRRSDHREANGNYQSHHRRIDLLHPLSPARRLGQLFSLHAPTKVPPPPPFPT